MSPILVENRTRFQDSEEIVTVAGEVAAAAVITGVTGMFPVPDSVLTGDADCWVHPAAKIKAATSTHASSTVRTGDDIVKCWNDKKIEVAGQLAPRYECSLLAFRLVAASEPEDQANRNNHRDQPSDEDEVSFPTHGIRVIGS